MVSPAQEFLVRVQIMSLYDINTINQTFECKVWIKFCWTNDFTWCDTYMPSFVDSINGRILSVKVCAEKKTARIIYQGVFPHVFDMRSFPFDVQVLKIRLFFYGLKVGVVNFVPTGISNIFMETMTQQHTWTVHGVRFLQEVTERERNEAQIQHPILSICIPLTRRPGFYLWNLVAPCHMLSGLGLTIFIIEDVTNQLNAILMLLLTLIALKSSVSQFTPITSSQLTALDKNVVCNIGIIGWLLLVVAISDSSEIIMQPWIVIPITGTLWVLCNIHMWFKAIRHSALRPIPP